MFQPKKVLVAGDLLFDVYAMGNVKRISPEAPVPVLHVSEEKHLPGGSGNTILNLISLGMEVTALSRVGSDPEGTYLLEALATEGVNNEWVVRDASFQTPVKKRLIAAGQQLLRMDYETISPISSELENVICSSFECLLREIDVVAISDYGKGFLTPYLLKELITAARSLNIPIIVDPKGNDFLRYQGATLIKPNLLEARQAAGLGSEATLDQVAHKILREVQSEMLMITRSEEGISLFHKEQRHDFSARVHKILDVTGAGDTVLAVMTAAFANKMDINEAVELANIAAGIAIEQIGCARISLHQLQEIYA